MKHIKTLTTRNLKESMKKGGCGECQTSVRMQDVLHGWQPELREDEIIQTQKRPDISSE